MEPLGSAPPAPADEERAAVREPAADAHVAPAPNTVEGWAYAYVLARELAAKLTPTPTPHDWEQHPVPRRLARPGRPPEFVLVAKSPRTPRDLVDLRRRAQLFHSFLHHELQAAELMCWALLAFPEAPAAFRRGLVVLFWDEIRHLGAYAAHLVTLGFRPGDFPVRDWFWERVPSCATPASFTATLGIGFEGGNLDHGERFAERLRVAGDHAGSELSARVAREEEAHVRFAWLWFWRLCASPAVDRTPEAAFRTWAAHLPPPLSPMLMRGFPLAHAARRRGGLPDDFVARLARWPRE